MIHKLIKGSSENMAQISDESIHLTVTSPPYNEGKNYAGVDDSRSPTVYYDLLSTSFGNVYKKLVPGGRLCINIANLGRYNKKKNSVYKRMDLLIAHLMSEIGFIDQGTIIWHKGASANVTTAWGSYCSPTAPVLRDTHEYILVFSKPGKLPVPDLYQTDKKIISKMRFHELTKSVWTIPAVTNKNHPCTFPIEIPMRLIELYSFPTQLVLDHFAGSGTTAAAAKIMGRSSISFEISQDYQEMICKVLGQKNLYHGPDIKSWFSFKEVVD